MEGKADLACYLRMMIDVLGRKKKVLEEIRNVTEEQTKILENPEPDSNAFNATIDKKNGLIDKINEMDEGFQTLYNRIGEQIREEGREHAELIGRLRSSVSEVTDLGVEITVLEHKNKTTLESRTNEMRRGKKNFKVSKQTADRYYRNMTGLNVDSPVFMDQKH